MSNSNETRFSKLKAAVPAIVLTGLATTACSNASPEERLTANYDPEAVASADCYTGVFSDSNGAHEGLRKVIKENPELDIDKLNGLKTAASGILDTLDAIRDLADEYSGEAVDEDIHSLESGDTFSYCVDDNGKIIPGNPKDFRVIE